MTRVEKNRPANGKVRSLLLAESFLPHRGGSRTYYYHLFRNWRPDEVTVLTRKVPGWQEFDARESNEYFRIVRRGRPSARFGYTDLPKAVAPLLQASIRSSFPGVDVVHSGDLFPQGLIALMLKRTRAIPYVAFCHGEEITQSDRFRRQPAIRNRIYRSANAVIANAEYARRRLLEIGVPSNRIHKITPGVDCDVFAPGEPDRDLQSRYGLQRQFVLLTVARLIARKGHDMVIRAVARLTADFPDIRYLIAGKGPEEDRLRELAADLGIAEKVVFAGFVPDEQLADIYRLSNLAVMPNREQHGDLEGFGITFLEASATSKPVIGGRSGGASEAVSHGVSGELIDPTDLEQLVAAIRGFLLDPAKAQSMGRAGRNRALTDFDWRSRAQHLCAITRGVAQAAVGQTALNGAGCQDRI